MLPNRFMWPPSTVSRALKNDPRISAATKEIIRRVSKEMGFQVPEDVAVVGFDDADTELMTYLRLTTISYDVREMGRLAAKAMIERIEAINNPLVRTVLEPKLVIRHSCGFHLHSS
ncbi:MAG: LacI family DNA-binding transcriptional regulator [Deltaproteobacteria bacterium]|nr:LacI family DNA-binding transcriptional regulator [Deltaproteobacteria bacterium]MBW2150222.1 LacI family DNA-binding transcriptional regulator [Deltaproteobacteria bacterium]